MVAQIVRYIAMFLLILIAGCFSAPIQSSVNIYRMNPEPKKISGSWGQTVRTITVGYDAEDVRYAVKKAAGFDGLTIDVDNTNMLSGFATWVPPGFTGGCTPSQVFAIYIDKTNKENESKVTIIADHLGMCASGTNSHLLIVQRLISNMNTILATFD